MSNADIEKQVQELRIAREQRKRDIERQVRQDQDRELVLQRQALERQRREGNRQG